MALELKQEELNRLDDLLSNERRGKMPHIPRLDMIKITADQVLEVKSLLAAGVSMVNI